MRRLTVRRTKRGFIQRTACADFKSDWEGGFDKLREAVDGIKGAVDQAVQGYSELETGLEDTLRKMKADIAAENGANRQ